MTDHTAPCGDTFGSPDDAKAHEATCGACEGAKEVRPRTLTELADGWDRDAQEAWGDRVINDDADDMVSDGIAETYAECAKDLRAAAAELYVVVVDFAEGPEVSVHSTRELAVEWIEQDMAHSFGNMDGWDDLETYEDRVDACGDYNVFYTINPAQLDPTD
jgi:hypothetical protein